MELLIQGPKDLLSGPFALSYSLDNTEARTQCPETSPWAGWGGEGQTSEIRATAAPPLNHHPRPRSALASAVASFLTSRGCAVGWGASSSLPIRGHTLEQSAWSAQCFGGIVLVAIIDKL